MTATESRDETIRSNPDWQMTNRVSTHELHWLPGDVKMEARINAAYAMYHVGVGEPLSDELRRILTKHDRAIAESERKSEMPTDADMVARFERSIATAERDFHDGLVDRHRLDGRRAEMNSRIAAVVAPETLSREQRARLVEKFSRMVQP